VTGPLTTYPGFERHPGFSPDGRQVTFSWNGEKQNNYDIYVVLTSGGPPLRLTTSAARDTAPAWSPDGRYIAFIRDPGPSGAVYLISPLGGPDRKIAETKGHSVCWTADSTSIGTSDCRSFNVKARRMLPFASCASIAMNQCRRFSRASPGFWLEAKSST
jgi:dipeptidyl aminopeptidase/acylaminoacyl peptidase